MKKGAVVVFFMLFLGMAAWASHINADISNSTMTNLDGSTFRLHNMALSAPEINASGIYWVDFQWDPINYRFVPVNLGEEPVLTGKSWSWQVWNGYSCSVSATYRYDMVSDPANRLLYVAFVQKSGTPFICPMGSEEPTFIQGNNAFSLSTCETMTCVTHPDNSHARITFATAFDGCGYIYIRDKL